MQVASAFTVRPLHPWLQRVHISFVPGPMSPLLEGVADGVLRVFQRLGHQVQDVPDQYTDAILTTAPFGKPLRWREALLFTARRRFNLSHTPTLYTLVHARPDEFFHLLDYFREVLKKEPPDPKDYDFPGLAPNAYKVLFEQGRRGGPILALQRLIQAQTKSIRVILVVGEDKPLAAYHFDLVGAFPKSRADDLDMFYEDIALRMVTTLSTREVTEHQVVPPPIPRAVWDSLPAPKAMQKAARELGKRHFFTEMVRIADLVKVPAVADAVASQYSEGCFATWEPRINALIATVTGSARPVDKDNITDDDLAVIVGVRPDGRGALVRHVENKRNDPPSSEAVEMYDMDTVLPRISLGPEWPMQVDVPVVRSKLHGHRGIAAYDPTKVEFVPLDEAYYHYLVSCATEAQARGIKAAFARSQALQNPDDPRKVVFTVLPGHGVVMAEKWVPGKEPFQLFWEYMDEGALVVDSHVPQGPMWYEPDADGQMILKIEEDEWPIT
ncbi:MAG: hypothetical protein GXO55_04395 [Chloroflexi bacterium]|nr:hypothetical protein [Chloroflexota bacterium]